MARKSDRKALGRGLSALLGDSNPVSVPAGNTAAQAAGQTDVAIDLIDANPDQPRKTFSQKDLEELSESIKKHGVIQPILLRNHPSQQGRYQIVAGERRWRAAQKAGVHNLPALVRDIDDRGILELAIIENVQRVDLDPVEEAQGYSQLIESFGYTQEELAQVIGKSRSHLANSMRLLSLPTQVLDLLRMGKLTSGHARALVTSVDPAALAQQVVSKGLSVRQAEAMAKGVASGGKGSKNAPNAQKDADTRMLEGDLSAAIGMKVGINHSSPNGSGELVIQYKSLEDLDQLCQKLTE